MTSRLEERIREHAQRLEDAAQPIALGDVTRPTRQVDFDVEERRRRVMVAGVALVVAAALIGVVAVLRSPTGDVVSTSDQPPSDTAGSSTPTRSSTSATSPATTAPAVLGTPEIAPGRIALLAIGDSVMLGARDALRAVGYTVQAAANLDVSDVVAGIEQLHRDGALGDVVVVHVGTDAELDVGPGGLDGLAAALADVPHVFVLNVHADRPWADGINNLVDDLVSRYPNVTAIDWRSLAGNCPGQCFAQDEIHLIDDGRQYYANIIDLHVAAATGRTPNTVPNTTTAAGADELPTPPGTGCVHTVVEGDNPTVIASRYLVTVDELAVVNADNPTWNQFLIGDAIYIPANGDCAAHDNATSPPGDAAAWTIEPEPTPTPDAESFTALVTRLGCNGGVTGHVFAPTVSIGDTEIIVTFTVEHSAGGRCPTNDPVAYVVDVGEPIGERQLVDGSCLPTGEGASTSWCSDGGVRH